MIFRPVALASLLLPLSGLSQDPAPSGSAELDIPAIEARIDQVEGDPDLDDTARKVIGDRYRKALTSLQSRENFQTQEAGFREARDTGLDEVRQLEAKQSALREALASPEKESEFSIRSTPEEVGAALVELQDSLASAKAERQDLDREIASIAARPTEIRSRLSSARSELRSVLSEASSRKARDDRGLSRDSEIAELDTRVAALESEIAMLEQEDASFEIRTRLLDASRNLADLRARQLESRISTLQELSSSLLANRIRRARDQVEQFRSEVPDAPAKLEGLIAELNSLIKQSDSVREKQRLTEEDLLTRSDEFDSIRLALEDMRRQSGIGGLDGILTQLVAENLRLLPSRNELNIQLGKNERSMQKARQERFELERSLRSETSPGDGEDDATGEGAGDLPPDLRSEFENLVQVRDTLRASLLTAYNQWIRRISDLDSTTRLTVELSEEFREFAVGNLFWVRSAPPVGSDAFAGLRDALAYCFGQSRFKEALRRVREIPPLSLFVTLLLAGSLILGRRTFRRWIRESAEGIRRISTDQYWHTVKALAATVLLSLPAPVLFLALGAFLRNQPDASEWSFGLGATFIKGGLILFHTGFLFSMCRSNGLAEAHFHWDPPALRRLRRLTALLIAPYLAGTLLLQLVATDTTVSYFGSLGRIGGLVLAISLGIFFAQVFHREKGIAASAHRTAPSSLFGRLRLLWFWSAVLIFATISVLFLAGFVFTGLILIAQIEISLSLIQVSFVTYGLVLRWFTIRERRLALHEALERRRLRLEAAQKEAEEDPENREEVGSEEVFEQEALDLATVGEQTRKLIGFFIGIGLVYLLWTLWTTFAPILKGLDGFETLGSISLADLGLTLFVVAVTWATTRNLPGLLEMIVLRRLDIDQGTRNSITTLAQYAVVAIGAVFLFRQLGVDWSQFGWIAAALSVGLGFGLQEVVSNFICGIILLFERPVRVGDVVTVGGVDGVVTRIRMRATTIQNWDREEFIVPNKEFITGSLVNATLSSTVNRVVIPVGVAYGSDTGEALRLLEEACRENPHVLPEPAPLITFEGFGDSSLDLVIRIYLPDREHRLQVITEIHREIDRKFREAGIEIPFPQRDLHLRSVDPGIDLGRPPVTGDAGEKS